MSDFSAGGPTKAEHVDYKVISKALQFVTERNPDLVAPILCKLWDDTTADGVAFIFDFVMTSPHEGDPQSSNLINRLVAENLNPAVSAMKTATVDFLVEMARYRRWLDEQTVVNRRPLPVPDMEGLAPDEPAV